jgi:nitrogen regulatory protein PII
MKTIHYMICPHQCDAVCRALAQAGITDVIVSDARVFACQDRSAERSCFRKEDDLPLWPVVKIEIVVADRLLPYVVYVILQAATLGPAHHGTIFVSPTTPLAPSSTTTRLP